MNKYCPDCIAKTWHSLFNRIKYHPLAGHGFNKEQGWTHPEAKKLHDEEQLKLELEKNKKK